MYCLYNKLYYKFNFFYIFKNCKFLDIQFKNLKTLNFNFYSSIIFINKFASSKNIVNKNSFDILFKYNNRYYYNFNKSNNFLFKKIFNILTNLFYNKYNALVLDSSYKTVLPVYNYIFGTKNLYANKDFFFMKKKNLTRNNWLNLYKINLKKFKVNILIVTDYFYFRKFLPILKNFNLPIISLIPFNIVNLYADYYVFTNYANQALFKFFLIGFYSSIFFKYNLLSLFKNKFLYFNKINNFLKIIN